jgi:MFS family permease
MVSELIIKLKANWKTQLTILWIGQAILMAMMAMSLPYWPLYLSHLGNFTPYEIRFWSAAIYIAPFISSTFSSPIWGNLADKYGYKPMVIRACVGLFLTQTLILFSSNVLFIFLIRLLQGILAGFIVAAQAWAMAISPDHERGATIGKLQSATAVGNLLGPLLGGVIATYGGYYYIFTSSSVICAIVTMLFILLLQSTTNISNKKPDNNSNAKRSSLSYLQKQVLSMLIVIIMIQLARAMITPVFSLFVTEHLGGNDITVGILYAATGLMIFVTAPSWGKWFDSMTQAGQPIHLFIATLLFISAGLQVLHAYAETATAIFILRLLWGICLGALLPILLRLLVDNADSYEQGFFLGLGNGATKFGNLLGIIVGALIEAHFGYANSFLMTAVLYMLSGVIILLYANPLKFTVEENKR